MIPPGSTAGWSAACIRATAAHTPATTSPSTWPATADRPRSSICGGAKRFAATCSRAWPTARRSSSGAATTTRGGIPGPERSHTWVNQPDAMHGSTTGAGYKPGQARYGNAVYVYRPDFAGDDYREALAEPESRDQITLEFYTPYIIGATPPRRFSLGHLQARLQERAGAECRAAGRIATSRSRSIKGTTWSEKSARGRSRSRPTT